MYKIKCLRVVLCSLVFALFSFNHVAIASVYEVISIPVVRNNSIVSLGTIIMEFSAGELQNGDMAIIKLPSDFKFCNPGEGEMTQEDWQKSVVDNTYRIGNDQNYLAIPQTFKGKNNGLYNCQIDVSQLDKNEIKIQLIENPALGQECFLYLYLGAIYVDDGFDGDIETTINTPIGSGFDEGVIRVGRVINGEVDIDVIKLPFITNNGVTSEPVILRIKEGGVGSLKGKNNSMVLTLPDCCKWAELQGIKIIWGDETFKEILTDQDNTNGSISLEDNVFRLNLPGFWSEDASCLELALNIKVTDPDALSGDIVAVLSGESNFTESEIIVAYVDRGFGVSQELNILDNSFESISGNPVTGNQYYLSFEIMNNNHWSHDPMVVIQVTDANDRQVYFNVIKGVVNGLQTNTYYSLFTPPAAGNYNVEVFVWSNWLHLGGQPLADKRSFNVKVN